MDRSNIPLFLAVAIVCGVVAAKVYVPGCVPDVCGLTALVAMIAVGLVTSAVSAIVMAILTWVLLGQET